MDFQTTSPAPIPSAATSPNAAGDKVEGNEFIIAGSYPNTIEYDCVSLDKVSDPSNVLEERSHLLQGTTAPALQGPVTAPDEDYNPIPATIFLPLPRELVERILILLDSKSTLKCRLVNRELNAIIQSSTVVQYHLACHAAGIINNPQSPFSYAERLEALKRREDSWRNLKPVFEMTIKVNNTPPTFSEMSAGNYFLNDNNRKDLYCCHFPSSLQDKPQWRRIPGHVPGQSWPGSVAEVGIAVYEHDLVVNVISSEVGNQADMHSLDLVLLKFSTGEHHPLARHSLIHVQRSRSGSEPCTSVRIVGDNLALVVHDDDGSKLFIFDWRTGHKRLQHQASDDAYYCSVPVFISAELLLVPNCILSHFEIWHLHSHPDSRPPIHILSLRIPTISVNYSVSGIYCHGEPSPFLYSIPSYLPPRPFFLSSENSIITANIYLQSHPRLRAAYKLIVHRRALLDMIQKLTSPSILEQQRTWLTNEVTVQEVADPDDGSVRLGAQSKLVLSLPHLESSPRDSPTLASPQISPTSPSSHIPVDTSVSSIPSGSALVKSRYNISRIQWANWGPPISRWFQVNESRTMCINQSTGQRCVFLDPNPRDKGKCVIVLADFNLCNVRRNVNMMAQFSQGKGEGNGAGEKEDDEELEILEHGGDFSEEVYMGLKCAVYHAPGEYDFDVVLMDEERLLGLKVGDQNREESINVLYFG